MYLAAFPAGGSTIFPAGDPYDGTGVISPSWRYLDTDINVNQQDGSGAPEIGQTVALQTTAAIWCAAMITSVSRREHVSLVVGFRRLDLGLGSSIRVYGGGGRASAAHRASS